MPLVRFIRQSLPWSVVFGLALAAASVAPGTPVRAALGQVPGEFELEQVTEFSRIKVQRVGTTRTLWFVRDSGEEVVESKVDLKQGRRDDLLVEYTRFMFLSYVFNPQPKRVLIVGLGGGAMVHFLKIHDPDVKVDVVEIDPVIVSVADRYFDVRTEGNVDIKVADGFSYLREAEPKYDVIYMDAFLRPSGGTDRVGVPLHLKTMAFYDQVKKRLNPGGSVVFNLNPHLSVHNDIRTIREAFSNTYVFELAGYPGYVVVGSTDDKKLDGVAISAAAARIDARFKAPFSFRRMAGRYTPR